MARAGTVARAGAALFAAAALAASPLRQVQAQTQEPIKIGIISEESAIAGAGISRGAQIAVDAINAAGGVDGRKLEIVQYDDHNSAADAVRAFQRAVSQDKVVAVIGAHARAVHHHRRGQQRDQPARARRIRQEQVHVS
jgi:branched-chain amino acid transport system substrate-binding protein